MEDISNERLILIDSIKLIVYNMRDCQQYSLIDTNARTIVLKQSLQCIQLGRDKHNRFVGHCQLEFKIRVAVSSFHTLSRLSDRDGDPYFALYCQPPSSSPPTLHLPSRGTARRESTGNEETDCAPWQPSR
ncbi:hypothetical protein PRIPAC_78828 [Pristionchus pacificus]|uniref:Uncharacterized protein n=1 Tax=Pristionchus pacificus TaxID=54126 RepID=A0A2A6BV61_PRIPA|nr:hypothetical protein PRIPAC_78828 [Pristionchus pacificus]|eukprot:PDM69882.1 hypothetical protein PRIPAC_49094 [Pristionchus pacificus]